jgi:DNA invertase Pin-like site-specific DNA recombinase
MIQMQPSERNHVHARGLRPCIHHRPAPRPPTGRVEAGRLFFHLFGAIAEFDRTLIQERTRAGLAAARARGRLGGTPRALSPQREKEAVALLQQGKTRGEVAVIYRLYE